MFNKFGLTSIKRLCVTLFFCTVSLPSFAENTVGELEINTADGQRKTALLLDTEITGDINGMLANITVQQTFKNDSDDWVNGRYVFPLPEGAAVDGLTIQIGDRVINSVIKEKAEAKKVFEQAKLEGKKAGLLQQHRPNLFSIAVANIGPRETLIANITFIDKVRYENDSFSLRLPTTLTPRYIPGADLNLSSELRADLEKQLSEQTNVQINGAGWSANTTSVPDAADITPPQTHKLIPQTSHRFSLKLSLDAGLSLQKVDSESHRIDAKLGDDKQFEISLANGHELMNADLQLTWQPIIGAAPKAAMFQQPFGDSVYSMLMLAPPTINTSLSIPRDITFIVDSSGSMAGESMTQAKQSLLDALNYLSSSDKFNIVDFDSSYRPLFQQSQNVTDRALRNARNMINGLDADGGTEMVGALRFALFGNSDPSYLKQIIFITDGAIGNETELFKLIEENLNDTRLFTVGIGSAPNSYFMNKAAKFGRGSYTYISNVNQVTEKMAVLFNKITRPVLRDVKIAWPEDVEQYPARIPDLYAGEPLMVVVKSKRAIKSATIEGSMLNTPWTQKLSLASAPSANNLDAIWGRDKVADLMDKFATGELTKEQVKTPIIELGIAHHIVTKFTSLVAVDESPSKPTQLKAKHKNLANLMPKGSTMPAPNTATPATLLSLLGLFVLTLGSVVRRFGRPTKSSTRETV